MKKVFNFFVSAAIGLSTVVFSSCEAKEDPAKPVEVNMAKTATINGRLLCNVDRTLAEQRLTAPPTTSVDLGASIEYHFIRSGLLGTYVIDNITYNPTTGDFTIVVPVGNDGGTVNIWLSPFTGTQRQFGIGGSVERAGSWSASISNQFVRPGQTIIIPTIELTFNESTAVGDTPRF